MGQGAQASRPGAGNPKALWAGEGSASEQTGEKPVGHAYGGRPAEQHRQYPVEWTWGTEERRLVDENQ
jgi:hypothetical protein